MATNLERLQKLQEQLDNAKTDAISELTEEKKKLQAQINDIDRQIREITGEAPKKVTRAPSSKPCSVCGEFGHDARKHRAENIAKKKAQAN